MNNNRNEKLKPGTVIGGRYEIISYISAGAMGDVYKAYDKRVNRICAVRHIIYPNDKELVVVERDMFAKLDNPRIPRITDIIEEDGFYVIMEYIEGETLRDALRKNGAFPQEQVVEWAKTLCDIFIYLHTPKGNRGKILFRDLKPGNIMLKADNDLVLFGFSIAVEVEGNYYINSDMGHTPGYGAPEQVRIGAAIDERTDIYGLGTTVFSLLTGVFLGMKRHIDDGPSIREIKPEISPGLEKIVEKCTAENPDERYQSFADLRAALDHWMNTKENGQAPTWLENFVTGIKKISRYCFKR